MKRVRPLDGASDVERAEWVRMRGALYGDADHADEVVRVLAGEFGPTGVFVLPRDDGRLAGMVEVGERSYAEGCASSPVAYIEGWWVDEDVRRRGHGTQLIRAAEAWARARGHREIASDADISNDISIRAHHALGYREVERIVVFRRDLHG